MKSKPIKLIRIAAFPVFGKNDYLVRVTIDNRRPNMPVMCKNLQEVEKYKQGIFLMNAEFGVEIWYQVSYEKIGPSISYDVYCELIP